MFESHPFGLKETNVTYSVPPFIAHILKQECMEALLHWKPASAKQFHDMWCIEQKEWHIEATSYMWKVTIVNAHILRTSLQTVNYLIYLHCCASAIDLGVDLSQLHHLKSYIKTESLQPTS